MVEHLNISRYIANETVLLRTALSTVANLRLVVIECGEPRGNRLGRRVKPYC